MELTDKEKEELNDYFTWRLEKIGIKKLERDMTSISMVRRVSLILEKIRHPL